MPLAYGGWQSLLAVAAVTAALMFVSWFRAPEKDHARQAIAASGPVNRRTVSVGERVAATLPGKVFFRSHDAFLSSLLSYWSSQERDIVPHCIVRPTSVEDVQETIRVLAAEFDGESLQSSDSFHFAIRSGGHGPNASSANTQGGITLDLSQLNFIHVSDDRGSTVVGPGARWIDLYEKLDPMGLTVAGGRASNVGVGGLTLGGGISFFSPRTGFVCDNIEEFEVVRADGEKINASNTENRDLWVALKGGGNNFGVVTKLTIRTFTNSKLWAGYLYHPVSVGPRLMQVFYDFGEEVNRDPYANALLALGYDAKMRVTGIASIIQYTKAESNPKVLKGFMDTKRFWSTVKFQTHGNATKEVNAHSPAGRRQLFQSTTFENDFEMLSFSHDLFKPSLDRVKPVKGIAWALVFHSLPVATTSKGSANAMGLNTNKNLVVAEISASWQRRQDDETVCRVAQDVLDKIDARATEKGVFHRYKYANYATPSQDTVSSYGDENKTMLREVSRKYDPNGVFQRGCVGGFKLP
ncbi:MAG: hypothetical protein Q9162_002065 [Coniocarpon cinnabarinum]